MRPVSIFRKIHELLTPAERRRAVVLLVLLAVGMLAEAIGIGLVIPAVALMLRPDFAERYPALRPVLVFLGNPSQARLVIDGMALLLVVFVIKAGYLHFLARYQTRFAFEVQTQLSQRLFTTYLLQPYAFHLNRNSAQLISKAITEVNVLTYHCTMPAIEILAEGLILLGLTGLLMYVEPTGTIVTALVLAAGAALVYRVAARRTLYWGAIRQTHEGLRMLTLQQALGAAKDVKLLGRESDFLEQYHVHSELSSKAMQYVTTQTRLPRLWLEAFAVAGLAVLVVSLIARGRDTTSIVPTLVLFGAVAFRLLPSANRIIVSVQSMRYALPVIGELWQELRLPVPAQVAVRGRALLPFQRDLQLAGVSYSYEGASSTALRDVSFTIRKGEFVGFLGPSGSGKSTLVDVVLGLLAPSSGRVLVDGADIGSDLRAWQDQIGYVPQSIYLTDDTLTRNVAFGIPDAQIDHAAVARAIAAAQLTQFVAALPLQMETVVGERGVRLSGGQCQRIGIARALYHDPAVLVLDEATSALDSDTERDVMNAVTALQWQKTILVVAHRFSTINRCDRLYRLDAGQIVQVGSPEELLQPAPP